MTFSLNDAFVADVESFPDVFTLTAESLHGDNTPIVWEISRYRDDRASLLAWLGWLHDNQIPLVVFFGEQYDYPMLHYIFTHPTCTVQDIYQHNQSIINSQDRFGTTIWPRDRFCPVIDLAKIHHFDNRAKGTGLKALEINMRSPTVMESPVPFGQPVGAAGVDAHVIPYNKHDVKETKRFAHISMGALQFRVGLIPQFGIECLSWNDGKIGAQMLERRLGEHVCYDTSSGRKQKRQTPRYRIALNDIIFPYIKFDDPEFARVLDFMRQQVLTPDDLDDPESPIRTKGAIKVSADVGGIEFVFGTGGVHGSVNNRRFTATEDWIIRDIDVGGQYPAIAIQNRLAPAHLGEVFVAEYAKIPEERKQHAKGTYLNALFKLAANVPWGQSNNKYSIFYDPQYAMTIPINGQLLICMLAEKLVDVPTVRLISANTDGITYMIHRSMLDAAKAVEQQWQEFTLLTLEDTKYSAMWVRDVNSYIAQHSDGKLKQKGAYWHPDPRDYENSISNASPPAWHKDLSNIISVRAAVVAMVHGIDPETFIRCHSDPFDFMLRAKVDRASTLFLGDQAVQSTFRYYVAIDGAPLAKVSPPPAGHAVGQWKRRNGVSVAEYDAEMRRTGGEWSESVCTKARTKYEDRRTAIQAGWKAADCNDARNFSFANVDYSFYVNEARKLIIS